MTLKEFFSDNPKAAIALSGGADSAYLLYAAKKYNADVRAYYVRTAFAPRFETEDAKRLARELGAELIVIDTDILCCDEITSNPPDRCYYCKKRIFTEISHRAAEDGYTLMLDGTNASDDPYDRPGIKALRELKVLSPLRLCGLTKRRIRELSKEAGLFTYDKPAYACLATRIPQGTVITDDMLRRIEMSEEILFNLHFSDFRVRVINGAARLQFTAEDIDRAFSARGEIIKALIPYFDAVLLDLREREKSA